MPNCSLSGYHTDLSQNFFVVMITPVIINRLQWKAYLIFMVTNFAFVPLVYFCYPETANLTLEEIDYLFVNPDKGAVKLSKELAKGRRHDPQRQSIVADTGIRRRMSSAGGATGQEKQMMAGANHLEGKGDISDETRF